MISQAQFNIISHQLILHEKDYIMNPYFNKSMEYMEKNIEHVNELYPIIWASFEHWFIGEYGKLPPKEWSMLI